MNSPSQKIKAPVCMYTGYSWKRKFRFSAFNNTRPHEAYLNWFRTSTGKRLKTIEMIASPYRACVMLVVNDWCMTSSYWKTSVSVRLHRKLGRESALWWTKTPFTCGRKENLRFLKKYPVGFEGASVFRWTESFLNIIFKFFRCTMFNQLVTIEVWEKFHAV